MHRLQSTLRQLAPALTMSSTTTSASSDPVLIDACALYQAAFGVNPKDVPDLIIASAPGRVNLIGEHTDYNDGFVFPCAIAFHTIVMGRKNGTEEFRLISSNMLPKLPTPPPSQSTSIISDDVKLSGAPQKRKADEITPDIEKNVVEQKVDLKNVKPIIFDSKSIYQRSTDGAWHNYLRGVLNQYRLAGLILSGMDIAVCGNVPLGGGLSSSASLEVATATFLDGILGINTPGPEKALLCQGAEHTFAGVPCGIMDQFVVANATEGHALLLDCRSQKFKLVPIDDPDVTILITNSNVKHELTGGEYKSRREQCEEAVRILSQQYPDIKKLRDATLEQLNAMEEKMDELVFHRARHIITENERTEKAATLLPTRDYTGFGRLMIHSHVSMKNDFEISCQEIDTLVDIALECEGVYGSRMTGGGFGGCTVTLVKTSHVDTVMATIQKKYLERENKHATCFITRPANGTKLITL